MHCVGGQRVREGLGKSVYSKGMYDSAPFLALWEDPLLLFKE